MWILDTRENNWDGISSQTEKVSQGTKSDFNKVIESFQQSNDAAKQSYSYTLERLRDKIPDGVSEDSMYVLGKMLETNSYEQIEKYIWELETLINRQLREREAEKQKRIREEREKILWINDSNRSDFNSRARLIVPAELSDEDSLIYWKISDSIKEEFEKVKNLSEQEVLRNILWLRLTRSVSLDDMDEHFNDLLDAPTLSEQEKFALEEYILDFKKHSVIYNELLEKKSINLQVLNDDINQQARLIYQWKTNPDGTYTVDMKGDVVTFSNKKEALLALYQIKLHLNNIEPYMIPYVWESYMSWWKGNVFLFAVSLWVSFVGYKYVKNRLIERMNRINEWLDEEAIRRLTNYEWTGTLDESIKIFRDNGVSDKEIHNMIQLANELKKIKTPPWADATEQLLSTSSSAYRSFARFRWRTGYLISTIFPIKKPLQWNPFKPRNIAKILAWSLNKWPDWWTSRMQREIFEDYVSAFKEFNETIKRIDEIMISQKKNPEVRWRARKEIISLFTRDFTLGFLRPNRTHPFKNKFQDIKIILSKHHIDMEWNDMKIIERRIKWEILPEVKNKIDSLKDFIHFHPELSDNQKKDLLRKIEWFQHTDSYWDFESRINSLIGWEWITNIKNMKDAMNLTFWRDSLLSETQLREWNNALISFVDTDIDTPNREVSKYISTTTSGHKWLIYFNIARIIQWQKPLETLDLQSCRKILNELNLWNVSLNQVLKFIKRDSKMILQSIRTHNGAIDTIPTPRDSSHTEQSTKSKTQTWTPKQSPEKLSFNSITDILDRAYIEAILAWKDDSILGKIEEEMKNINSRDRFDEVRNKPDIIKFYADTFEIPTIRAQSSLPTLREIKIEIAKIDGIDPTFSWIRTFSELTSKIKNTTDITIRWNIFDSIKKLRLSK